MSLVFQVLVSEGYLSVFAREKTEYAIRPKD